MKSIGFHPRLFCAAFLLICLTTLVLDTVGVHVTREFMYKRFNDRIEFLAKYLAMNSEVWVQFENKENLNSLALNLLEEEDVAQVAIFDGRGETLVEQSREVPGPLSTITKPILSETDQDENILFRDMSTSSDRNADGKIGEVQIVYSTHGIEQLIRDITIKYVWFSIGISFISGLVFYFVSHPMVKEVKQLTTAARQVGRGDMEFRVRPGKIPETRSLAVDFNAMLDSLKQSQEALERVNREIIQQKSLAEVGKFSMMIAHEVKNPLSIIKSSLDILKKDQHLDSQNMMVAYIEDEIQRLNRLIESFLAFARPMKPVFSSVDLNEMARSLINRFEISLNDTEVTIRAEIPDRPVTAMADSDLLVRGLGNILKNACEATGNRGIVSVESRVENDLWMIEISDNGEGIDTDKLYKVFEPFYTNRATGTGLGLAFTRQVVKAHGGSITVRNGETKGAVFTVEIPLDPSGRAGHAARVALS